MVHTDVSEGSEKKIFPSPPTYFLYTNQGLSLITRNLQQQSMSIYIDFLHGKAQFLAQKQRAWHHPLVKALGLSPRAPGLKVLDATAGLGQDAWVMHLLGCSLQLLERQPMAFILLSDALHRAQLQEALPLELREAHCYLSDPSHHASVDLVYLDPMFPEARKKSASTKGMAVFQEWIGLDDDADKLLGAARHVATQKVVVKRPRLASFLADACPHYSLEGRSTRFDIYLPY
jgi:16S rRNA (guanine1516-N2)-methyltransferase